MSGELRKVLLAAISVSSLNSRKNLEAGSEDAGIEELARSISSSGLISPPSVRDVGNGRYEVIAGQRRVLACQRLNWTSIDVFVTNWDDNAALGISLVENLQRADMHPLDKARGLNELVMRLGSEQAAATATGLSIPTVKKYVSLLKLPESVRAELGTGNGPSGVGAMAALVKNFGDDEESVREAWTLIGGFTGRTAENILSQSKGDLGTLEDLREQVLAGNFNVVRCGSSLQECPWISEVPEDTQEKILTLLINEN